MSRHDTPYRCVIFDCDGTLLDTLGDISTAMNHALAEHGFPPVPRDDYRGMVGWGIYRLAELALPEHARTPSLIQTLGDYAKRYMEEQPPEQSLTRPYPGIPALLTKLANMGGHRRKKPVLAVLSNKPDSVLRLIIGSFFGTGTFDAVCGLRSGLTAKPDPAGVWELLAEVDITPGETIFAGDSEIDIAAARNAGCYPLGVSWGFRSRATLESAGATRIIDRPEELLELLGKQVGDE